jgi:predicted acylesterase/phospholipase RssA
MKFDLVFEGGGAKGMVFVGALEVFEQVGGESDRLLGTSAGAITATLLAAGYRSQEMQAKLGETKDGKPIFTYFLGTPQPFSEEEIRDSALRAFLESIDLPLVPDFIERKLDERILHAMATWPHFRNLFSFIERGGWYAADAFLEWMREKLDEIYEKLCEAGTVEPQPHPFSAMNLEEFHKATGRELTLVASDITAARMLVLNHYTAPQCPVVWAARMSMSVPLLWQEVVWQPEWGLYRGEDIRDHAIVDGGLLSNFPIELFVSDEKPVTDVMGPRRSEHVLGMLIDESLPVPGAPDKAGDTDTFDFGQLRTVQRIHQILNTATMAHDRAVIEAFADMVVRLPAKGFGTTEFDMSAACQEALLEAGRQAMQTYFSEHPPTVAPEGGVSFDIGFAYKATSIANQRAVKILDW